MGIFGLSKKGKGTCNHCRKQTGVAGGTFCNRCDKWVCKNCQASGGVCKKCN